MKILKHLELIEVEFYLLLYLNVKFLICKMLITLLSIY